MIGAEVLAGLVAHLDDLLATADDLTEGNRPPATTTYWRGYRDALADLRTWAMKP